MMSEGHRSRFFPKFFYLIDRETFKQAAEFPFLPTGLTNTHPYQDPPSLYPPILTGTNKYQPEQHMIAKTISCFPSLCASSHYLFSHF